MTATSDPINVVHAFMKAFEKKDYETACRYVTEDCEYTNLPLGTVTGPEGVRSVLEPFFAPTLENKFVILREAVNGNTVFLERLDRHRLADKWVELPVTGVFEVSGGLISVWREYFDAATITSVWPQ